MSDTPSAVRRAHRRRRRCARPVRAPGVRGDVGRADRPGGRCLAQHVLPPVRRQGGRRLRRPRSAAGRTARVARARSPESLGRGVRRHPSASSSTSRAIPRSPACATRSCARCPPCASARSSPCSGTSGCSTSTCAARCPTSIRSTPSASPRSSPPLHNHVLRRLLRGTKRVPLSALRRALDDALRRYGVHPDGAAPADDDVVVAVFPRSMPAAEMTRRVRARLDG